MVGLLHHGDVVADLVQVLRHLQSDEAAADDDRLGVIMQGFNGLHLNLVAVSDVAQGEDFRTVHAWKRRNHRFCAGGQQQDVVILGVGLAVAQVLHLHSVLLAVDGGNFLQHTHIHVVTVAEGDGCLHEETFPLFDGVADVVG